AVTTRNDAPAPPTSLDAFVSGTNVSLAWQDNSTNESGFKLERKRESDGYQQIQLLPANSTSATDVGLEEDTTYTYRVRSTNDGGDSAYSNEASITTPTTVPKAPSN